VELLQDQVILNLQEGRERRVAPYDGVEVLETWVQAAEDVEDEDPVGDPRSARASAMFLNLRQYSLTVRSP
jgi:hypothetical protein